MGRAPVGADTAGDALFPVDGPGTVLPVQCNGAHGAVVFALPTEQALLRFNPDMGIRQVYRWRRPCHRLRRIRCLQVFRSFHSFFGRRIRRRGRPGRSPSQHFSLVGCRGFLLFPRFPGIRQGQAVGRAAVSADAAGDALLPVDGPGPVLPVQCNGFGRAVVFALSAEQALLRFDSDMGVRQVHRWRRPCHRLRRIRCLQIFRSFHSDFGRRIRRRGRPGRSSSQHFPLVGRRGLFLFSRFPGIRQGQAVGRAAIGAHAAGDALLPVDSPGPILPIQCNGAHGAVVFALSAEQALLRLHSDVGIRQVYNFRAFRTLWNGNPFLFCGTDRLLRNCFCRFGSQRFGRPPDRRHGSVQRNFTGTAEVASQGQAFPGAVVDAGTAVHAGLQVNAPGPGPAVHRNGAGGAVPHALAAENTFDNIIDDLAPVIHGISRHGNGRHFPLYPGRAFFLVDGQDDF